MQDVSDNISKEQKYIVFKYSERGRKEKVVKYYANMSKWLNEGDKMVRGNFKKC